MPLIPTHYGDIGGTGKTISSADDDKHVFDRINEVNLKLLRVKIDAPDVRLKFNNGFGYAPPAESSDELDAMNRGIEVYDEIFMKRKSDDDFVHIFEFKSRNEPLQCKYLDVTLEFVSGSSTSTVVTYEYVLMAESPSMKEASSPNTMMHMEPPMIPFDEREVDEDG